jgi:DNA-binding beta-propeller fold protein YncE
MYISLTGSPSICVIDTKAQQVSFMGNRDRGRLSLPLGLALSADGRVFVADAKTKRIFAFDAKGELKTAIGGESVFNNPAAVAVNDELGRLYVVDSYAHNVRVFSLMGEPLFDFGKRGNGEGEFNFPSNVAIDKRNGNVVIVDTQNFRVQVFDKDGKFLRKFGRLGDQVGNFSRPKGVGIDSEGNIYVTDAAFDNFQVFDEKGQILLFIGRAGMDLGNFQLPAGLFVDDKDRIYVVDSLNSRVQVFQYMSEKWKRANPEQYEKYRFKPTGEK